MNSVDGCPSGLGQHELICPFGVEGSSKADFSASLKVGDKIDNRYIVESFIGASSDGFTYRAIDKDIDKTVYVSEFFPHGLAMRTLQGQVVSKDENPLVFKSMQYDFIDLLKVVQQSSGAGVPEILNIFQYTGTAYGIVESVEMIRLYDIVSENNSGLTLFEAKKIILGLCNALVPIHNLGVIHGGISPGNVYVDDMSNTKLMGFSTVFNSVHGGWSDKLCAGFAAPEQYDANKWQGSWTDVYSLGAIMYYILSGKIPQDAQERLVNDELVGISLLVPGLAKNIADAIAGALNLDPDKRTQSIEEFSAGILQTQHGNTSVFSVKSAGNIGDDDRTRIIGSVEHESPRDTLSDVRRTQKDDRKASSRAGKLRFYALLGAVIVFVTVGAAVILSGIPIDDADASSSSRLPVPEPNYVPSFESRYIEGILENTEWTTKFDIKVRYEYDDNLPEGIVISQAPQSNVKMINRGIVILTVSKGPQKIPMPNLIGSSTDFALRTLTQMEISYIVIEDPAYTEGTVGKTNFLPDQLVDKLNDRVEVYIGMRDVTRENEKLSSSSDAGDD